MDRGIPQGLIPGSLIFLLYENILLQQINPDHILLYADDTTLAYHTDNPHNINIKLNNVSL